jgi:MFS family permease
MKEYYRQFQGRGPDSLMQRNLRMCTEEGLFATPWSIISVPGNVFIAALLTSALGLRESIYGIIVSLPAWSNAAQFLFVPLLSRFHSTRRLTILLSFINNLTWLIFALSLHKLAAGANGTKEAFLLLSFLVISLSLSVASVSWMAWIQEWIPDRLRGKYFGGRNRLIGIASIAFVLTATWVLNHFGESILAFQIIIIICVLLRFVSVHLVTHIYTPWSVPEPASKHSVTLQVSEILKRDGFRAYLWFAMSLAFGLSITAPFAPVFMESFLGFSVSSQMHLLILASLGSAMGMPWWGKLCDHHGCRAILLTTGLLWMLSNFTWVFLQPETTWVLYPLWFFGGLTSSGVILAGFNLVLKLTPPHLKSTAVSLHLALTSIAAAIPPTLAGFFLAPDLLQFLSQELRYRFLFAFGPIWVIASLLLLARIDEPKSADINSVSGAFRTMRNIMAQSGVLMFANFAFITRSKRRNAKPFSR